HRLRLGQQVCRQFAPLCKNNGCLCHNTFHPLPSLRTTSYGSGRTPSRTDHLWRMCATTLLRLACNCKLFPLVRECWSSERSAVIRRNFRTLVCKPLLFLIHPI